MNIKNCYLLWDTRSLLHMIKKNGCNFIPYTYFSSIQQKNHIMKYNTNIFCQKIILQGGKMSGYLRMTKIFD